MHKIWGYRKGMKADESIRLSALFWCICIWVRLGIASAAFFVARNEDARPWLGWLSLLLLYPIIGWLDQLAHPARARTIGFSGGTMWWGDLRVVHTTLYASAIPLAWYAPHAAFAPLLVDVAFGAMFAILRGR